VTGWKVGGQEKLGAQEKITRCKDMRVRKKLGCFVVQVLLLDLWIGVLGPVLDVEATQQRSRGKPLMEEGSARFYRVGAEFANGRPAVDGVGLLAAGLAGVATSVPPLGIKGQRAVVIDNERVGRPLKRLAKVAGTGNESARLTVENVRFDEIHGSAIRPGWRRLVVDVVYSNQHHADYRRINLSKFVVVVEDGQYVYSPATEMGTSAPFVEERSYAPMEEVRGKLSFVVPANTGRLAIVHFTAGGPFKIELTPEIAAEKISEPVSAPVEATPLRAAFYGAKYVERLGAKKGAFILIDAVLTLMADDPLASATYDVARYVRFVDGRGRRYSPASVWDSLLRPLKNPELWANQPTRGQIAFRVEDESPPESGALEIYGGASKIRLEIPRSLFRREDIVVKKRQIDLGEAPPSQESQSPSSAQAQRVPKTFAPAGYNIASRALGGVLESTTSEHDKGQWSAKNLIDGFPVATARGKTRCNSCGWSSADRRFPQEIVFSFHRGREAEIAAVLVDPTTVQSAEHPERMAKDLEIWVSSSSPSDGFVMVAAGHLRKELTEQTIALPRGTKARYVKIVVRSNYGGSHTQLGEVRIIERQSKERSILTDKEINLARPELGGALVLFTSSAGERNLVGRLTDGDSKGEAWRSNDNYLPQDFVLAFHNDGSALIDRLVISSGGNHRDDWPKQIKILISDTSPLEGFEEVGTWMLHQKAGSQSFKIDKRGRFLKVRILENFGGRRTEFTELAVIEGRAPGYVPLLLRDAEGEIQGKKSGSGSLTPSMDAVDEIEPNDTTAQANGLIEGQFVRGAIDPLGESDYFQFDAARSNTTASFELVGEPNIRTSLSLLNEAGEPLKSFDPGRSPGVRTVFSWKLRGDEKFVRVSEPPVSVVLVWDTSGSMEGSTEDLEAAVNTYIRQLPSSQRVNLVRFSKDVEVLLRGFTSDKSDLLNAVRGKFRAEGGTRLYDAVAKGIELLEGVSGNKAIIVLSDGENTLGQLDHSAFWRFLDSKRTRIYAIGLGERMRFSLPHFGSSGNRILGHIAEATTGRSFFSPTSAKLREIYEEISEELHRVSGYYLKVMYSRGYGELKVVSTGERIPRISAPKVQLVLDASGSMKERDRKIGKRLKIDVAKDVMSEVIRSLPEGTTVAMRAYGHRIREGRRGDCQDSELLMGFKELTRAQKKRLLRKVDEIRALGTTPLSYSLRKAAGDFGDGRGEKVIILVTDGKEECGEQPHLVVRELQDRGIDVRVNIVGFALAEDSVKREMTRVAEMTDGRFFDAQDHEGLKNSLKQAFSAPYTVVDESEALVARGLVDHAAIRLPEGVYRVVVEAIDRPIDIANVAIKYQGFTSIELKKEGQEIGKGLVGPLDQSEKERYVKNLKEKAEPKDSPEPEGPVNDKGRAKLLLVQRSLKSLGLDPGPIDGVWGQKTKDAVSTFQRSYMKRSRSSGLIDGATMSALEQAVKEKWVFRQVVKAPAVNRLRPGFYRVRRPAVVYSEPDFRSTQVYEIRTRMRVNVTADLGNWLEIRSTSDRGRGFIRKQAVVE